MANLLLNTEAWDGSPWASVGAGASVTGNTHAAPAFAGGEAGMADTIEDTGTGSQDLRRQAVTVPNNSDVYTASVYMRKTTGTRTYFPDFQLIFQTGGTATGKGINVDTTTGDTAVDTGGGTLIAHGIIDVDANWWRAWIRMANNNTGNTQCMFTVYPARSLSLGGVANSTAVGTLVVWGAQLELGSTLTMYEPHPFYEFPGGQPGAITDLAATPGPNKVDLTWTPASGATSHYVQRRITP